MGGIQLPKVGTVYRFWYHFSGKLSRIVIESLDESDPRPFLAFAKVVETEDPDLKDATVVLAPRDGFVSGPPHFIDVAGSYSGPHGAEKYDMSRIYPDGDIREVLGKETPTIRRQWSDFVIMLRGLKHLLTSPEIRASMRRVTAGLPKGVKRGDGSNFAIAVDDLILIRKVIEKRSVANGKAVFHFQVDTRSDLWDDLVTEFPELRDVASRPWTYSVLGPHENSTWKDLREDWSDMALATAIVGEYWLTVGALGLIHWDNASTRRAGTFVIDENDEIAMAYYNRYNR